MDNEEAEPLENETEILRVGKSVYEVLHIWATSGTQLVYSNGTGGLRVEGIIRALREPEDDSWGIFDASFLFMSKTREITAHVLMMPGMKIVTKPSDEVRAVEFGTKGNCSLRPVGRRGPHPDDVAKVVAQLSAWVERKMRVLVYLDFGFSALASVCDIEAVNDQTFALTEEANKRTMFAIPVLSSQASVDDLGGMTTVTLTSEDRRSTLRISEPSGDKDEWMSRMASKMIQ
jgi:hypothetical protein